MSREFNYLKEKNRMLRTIFHDDRYPVCLGDRCYVCPLSSRNNRLEKNCHELEYMHADEAEKIVREWSEKNPEETNADHAINLIKKEFPIMENNSLKNNLALLGCCWLKCPHSRGVKCQDCEYYHFWEQPYKEGEEIKKDVD